jgi:ABC-type multidrug transport system fused ATPase/permease subunit
MTLFSRLWALLDARQRRTLVGLQALSLFMAASTVSGIAAVVPFFALLADPFSIEQHRLLSLVFRAGGFAGARQFTMALGAAFCAMVICANLVNYLGAMAMYRFSFQVGDAFRCALFDEYLYREHAFHTRSHSAALTGNVLHETWRIAGGILQNGLLLVTHLVTALFIAASVLWVNPRVATVAAAALTVSYVFIYAISRGKLHRNGLEETRQFERRNKITQESFGAIKEIALCQAQAFFARQFADTCRPLTASLLSTVGISQRPRHVLEVATVCGLVLGALYLSGGSESNSWIAQLSFLGLAAYRLLPALQGAFTAGVRISADSAAFDRIERDLRQATDHIATAKCAVVAASVAESVAARAADSWRGRPRLAIHFDGVSLRHAIDRNCALSDVTLQIEAGQTVGLIGANGAGKSTLVDVLTGLLEPDSGSVTIDGIRLDSTNGDAWRTTVAFVPQRISVLDVTVAQNIALGVAPALIDVSRLREAVRLAQLDECVAALPRGLDEPLGEHGSRLSGGQRQKLGIARALYRGASLLILDEATSALDAASERDIVDMLKTLKKERTIVMIAHRLRSLCHCDVIFELRDGRLLSADAKNTSPAPPGPRRTTADTRPPTTPVAATSGR